MASTQEVKKENKNSELEVIKKNYPGYKIAKKKTKKIKTINIGLYDAFKKNFKKELDNLKKK